MNINGRVTRGDASGSTDVVPTPKPTLTPGKWRHVFSFAHVETKNS